jgi:hypothetical protein
MNYLYFTALYCGLWFSTSRCSAKCQAEFLKIP